MDLFVNSIAVVSLIFLVLSCIEVGSNDATNLVNAVFGSRVLTRKNAVIIAGFFVVLGSSFSTPVMNTVRKSIFDIHQLDLYMSLSVFVAAYLVGTILLYVYSVFGMPVSTTATLVFCLAGGALGVLGSSSAVNWPKFGQVVLAIILSIFFSGFFAYFIQRAFRFIIGKDSQNHQVLLKHGGWVTSFMLIALFWFMASKGMKHVAFMKAILTTYNSYSFVVMMVASWGLLAVLISLLLRLGGPLVTRHLFHVVSVMGMGCMAFAFGQNDLANCASPGIAVFMIWSQGLMESLKVSVPIWALGGCGVLMFFGMLTQRAQRVTRAEVNTASQQNKVNLYAPNWCQSLAGKFLQLFKQTDKNIITPDATRSDEGKKLHYDALRASVILSVSACVIAFASSLGLPVSTTYVAFAAVVASGWGDKIFSRGQADKKLGRTIWVITGWFLGAAISFGACALVAMFIHKTQMLGLTVSIAAVIYLKVYYKNQGEIHERIYHKKKILEKIKKKQMMN